jgi:hypothetical protein
MSSHKIHRVSLPIVGNFYSYFYAFKVNAVKSPKKLGNYLALVPLFHLGIPHLNSHLNLRDFFRKYTCLDMNGLRET